MSFDPNATPECFTSFSKLLRENLTFADRKIRELAEDLERRARLAEEKLDRYRRAVQILKLTFENQGFPDAAKATQEKIDEIERVGK